MIAAVDELIIYDAVQYTRRDWRNRNRIKTPQGLHWLTVPVQVTGRYHQKIKDTMIHGSDWATIHWRTLSANYRRARHFAEIAAWLEPLYLEECHARLSPLNRRFIEAVCGYLGITTILRSSGDYVLSEGKTERLVDLCVQAGAGEYVSGPAAAGYIDAALFRERGIGLTFFDYSGYPEYPQLWGAFRHGVTILDLLFNCGRDAPRYMRHVGS